MASEDEADVLLSDSQDDESDFSEEDVPSINGSASSEDEADFVVDSSEDEGDAGSDSGEENDNPAFDESDSSEDEVAPRNTVGEVPLEWYRDEEHIGYNVAGKKLKKRAQKDQLDSFLARSDNAKDWRKIYDERNDEIVELTKEEVDLISRLRKGKTPHATVDPFPPYVDWFDWEGKGFPLSAAPEPKRRFIPSKWEAKKVVKLVRALRKGWLKLDKPKEKPRFYLMWGDDLQTTNKTANGLAYIPAPKPTLPGHEESYNPPPEYIPTQEEINSYDLMFEEDRPKFIPKKFNSLRQVPTYSDFIKERFERCLDLYLCPRVRKKRINVDPEVLLPKLPKAKDLQPYPTSCFQEYKGHAGAVSTVDTDPTGQWLVSGSHDCTVRLWEVENGRCRKVWNFGTPVRSVAFNPNSSLPIIAVAAGKEVALLQAEVGSDEEQANAAALLKKSGSGAAPGFAEDNNALTMWADCVDYKGIFLLHRQDVERVAWQYKGDYFTTVSPNGKSKSVLVHQLSKRQSHNPFKKHHSNVVHVLFHPSKPFLFVANNTHVRLYNLTKQLLAKKLITGLQQISSIAIHPGGDNLLVGSRESKLLWFDLDLSLKPYKNIKNHEKDVNAVGYHSSYPLFASCSEDASVHVFHGMVYSDLLQNPLIVPLKILRGHKGAVMDIKFHPKQPWIFSAGCDGVIKLFCN